MCTVLSVEKLTLINISEVFYVFTACGTMKSHREKFCTRRRKTSSPFCTGQMEMNAIDEVELHGRPLHFVTIFLLLLLTIANELVTEEMKMFSVRFFFFHCLSKT